MDNSPLRSSNILPPQSLGLARLVIGLLQGVLLYAIFQSSEARHWPATDPYALAVLAWCGCTIPVLAVNALGNLRWKILVAWLVAATLLCAAIAAHFVRVGVGYDFAFDRVPLVFALFFITQSLVVAGQSEDRIIASYPRYFDVSWNLGVQCGLAALFVGALWALLWLGSELFRLININLLHDLLTKRWFEVPVSSMALAYSLHVTDVRAKLVTGARTLMLFLLSWLLPIITVFAVLFIAALPFVGIDRLWATRHATSILLWSTAALVFLINAAYQDGGPDASVPLVLRPFRLVAALATVPLTALAGYGLWLRIAQYGWSSERVFAAVFFILAACYAVGYGLAAIFSRLSLKLVEPTNVATAFVTVGLLIALQLPIADPVRISVSDQLARLRSGKISADKFDYAFLRFRTGNYGTEALHDLADNVTGPDAAEIKQRSGRALAASNQFQLQLNGPVALAKRAGDINVVFPKGAALPDGFLQFDWAKVQPYWQVPGCLLRNMSCEAYLVDLDGDGRDEVLVFSVGSPGVALQSSDSDHWAILGPINNVNCPGVRDALRRGNIEVATPKFKEIVVAGQPLTLTPVCNPATSRDTP